MGITKAEEVEEAMETRAMKKARLLVKAEAMIEALLEWDEAQTAPTFTAIEEKVLQLRQSLGQAMAEVVVAGQANSKPAVAPFCPRCQRKMHYKGPKANGVISRLGEVAVERSYYYCQGCEQGLFPPG